MILIFCDKKGTKQLVASTRIVKLNENMKRYGPLVLPKVRAKFG